MSQIAVIYFDKKNDTVCCTQISDEYKFENYLGAMSRKQLAEYTKVNKLRPVNFSIDRNGEVVEDCGSFSRFGKYGESGVILAEIHNDKNETEGYKVLQCTPSGVIVNLTTETILQKNKEVNGSFIQNGIIRDTELKSGTVACYPQKPYPIILMHGTKKVTKVNKVAAKEVLDALYTLEVSNSTLTIKGKTEKKSGVVATNVPVKSTRDVALIFVTRLSKKVDKDVFADNDLLIKNCTVNILIQHKDGKCYATIDNNQPEGVVNATELGLKVVDYLNKNFGVKKEETKVIDKNITKEDKYTKEQKREILACRKKGIKSNIIENPKLQPSQMRIIWMAKAKGMFMNQVANPEFSEDALKAYADILYSKGQVNVCKPIIAHPEFDGEKVKAMYEALQHDINADDVVNLSVDEIYDLISDKASGLWDKPFSKMSDDEFEKIQGDITESILKTAQICKEKYAYRQGLHSHK